MCVCFVNVSEKQEQECLCVACVWTYTYVCVCVCSGLGGIKGMLEAEGTSVVLFLPDSPGQERRGERKRGVDGEAKEREKERQH